MTNRDLCPFVCPAALSHSATPLAAPRLALRHHFADKLGLLKHFGFNVSPPS
jgi:hypothetical protein